MIYNYENQQLDFWSNNLLPKQPKDIGISMSGGTDSSMLLILLCEEFKNNNITIWPAVGEDVNRASCIGVVSKVVEIVRKKYPTVDIKDPIVYPFDKLKNPDLQYKVDQQKHYEATNCEVFCLAPTQQPPHIEMTIGNGPTLRTRTDNFVDEASKRKWGNISYRPFIGINKKMIAHFYELFDTEMEIFPLTVSCVDMMKDNLVPCKHCAWCREKKWAFGSYDFGYL